MTDNVLEIHEIPDTIRFHMDSRTFDLDIVESQMKLEQIARALNPQDDSFSELLIQGVLDWLNERHGVNVSVTQAWTIFLSVRQAYEAYKKKLAGSLVSLDGITSTPGNSAPSKSSALAENSQQSRPTTS